MRLVSSSGFSTGSDAARIDWAFPLNKVHDGGGSIAGAFDVLFTVDGSKLAAGQSIRNEAWATCAATN